MAHAEMNESPVAPGDVVRADLRLRRLTGLAVVGVAVVGLPLMWAFQGYMQQIRALGETDLPEAIARTIFMARILAVLGVVGALGIGVWFWRLGSRTRRSGQYPPPGVKVIRDMPLRTGSKARTVANAAQCTAVVLVVAVSLTMWYLVRVAETLLQP